MDAPSHFVPPPGSGLPNAAPAGAISADVLTTGRAPGWPAPTPETISLVKDRGVSCIGTDGLSMGPAEGGAPVHLAGLPHGAIFVEALAGLDPLPPRGAWFLFLPLRLAGRIRRRARHATARSGH
jgi:kynurenine formamidase